MPSRAGAPGALLPPLWGRRPGRARAGRGAASPARCRPAPPRRAPAWPRPRRARSQWETPQRPATPPASRRAPHGRSPAPSARRANGGRCERARVVSRGCARLAVHVSRSVRARSRAAARLQCALQSAREAAPVAQRRTAQRDAPPAPATPPLQRVVQRLPCRVNAGARGHPSASSSWDESRARGGSLCSHVWYRQPKVRSGPSVVIRGRTWCGPRGCENTSPGGKQPSEPWVSACSVPPAAWLGGQTRWDTWPCPPACSQQEPLLGQGTTRCPADRDAPLPALSTAGRTPLCRQTHPGRSAAAGRHSCPISREAPRGAGASVVLFADGKAGASAQSRGAGGAGKSIQPCLLGRGAATHRSARSVPAPAGRMRDLLSRHSTAWLGLSHRLPAQSAGAAFCMRSPNYRRDVILIIRLSCRQDIKFN